MTEFKDVQALPLLEGGKVEFLEPVKKLHLNSDAKGFDFKAEGYSEDFLLKLVNQLKGLPSVSNQDVKVAVVPSVKVPENASKAPNKSYGLPIASTTIRKAIEEDKLVYSSDDKPLSAFAEKLGEQAKALYASAGVEHQDQTHEYHHTGIKYGFNDVPKYRCGYECPKCGVPGRHYVPLHIKKVSCHNCQTTLTVEPATIN